MIVTRYINLDSHTAPELCVQDVPLVELKYLTFTLVD